MGKPWVRTPQVIPVSHEESWSSLDGCHYCKKQIHQGCYLGRHEGVLADEGIVCNPNLGLYPGTKVQGTKFEGIKSVGLRTGAHGALSGLGRLIM